MSACGEVRPGTLGYQRCVLDPDHGPVHKSQDGGRWPHVVITQLEDVFSSRPGNLRPFKPQYRIEYPGMPVTPPDHNRPGTPIPAIYTNRAEARSFARRKANALDVAIEEVAFR